MWISKQEYYEMKRDSAMNRLSVAALERKLKALEEFLQIEYKSDYETKYVLITKEKI